MQLGLGELLPGNATFVEVVNAGGDKLSHLDEAENHVVHLVGRFITKKQGLGRVCQCIAVHGKIVGAEYVWEQD